MIMTSDEAPMTIEISLIISVIMQYFTVGIVMSMFRSKTSGVIVFCIDENYNQ